MEENQCRFYLSVYIARWRSNYQKRGRVVIVINSFIPPLCSACLKPEHGGLSTHVLDVLVLMILGDRWLFSLLILVELLTITA